MSRVVRFPYPAAIPQLAPSQANQIITLMSAVTSLPAGGAVAYVSTLPWKGVASNTETSYTSVAIEFSTIIATTIGDGTFAQQIGLFGRIGTTGNNRFLLGVLGVSRGGVAPQIPIITHGGNLVGFSQIVGPANGFNIAIYDELSIGGIGGAVPINGDGNSCTVRARPIIEQDFAG